MTEDDFSKLADSGKVTFAENFLGLDAGSCPHLIDPEKHLPPITKADFELHSSETDYTRKFECLSLLLRQSVLPEDTKGPFLPSYGETDLAPKPYRTPEEDKIQGEWIKEYLENPQKSPDLKIVGAYIDGDLDLSGLRKGGSLRLICCYIKGAFLFDRAHFRTLDLSGSIFEQGISGAHAEMDGALRLRRTVSKSPIDLPGIRVDALTDFSDCIIFPFNRPTDQSSFVTERGILNMSGADLRLGLRLQRSRIYGLTNLRSAEIGASFQANDAVLSSSLATFELLTIAHLKELKDVLPRDKDDLHLLSQIISNLPPGAFAILEADQEIANQLHSNPLGTSSEEIKKAKIERETLGVDSLYIDMLRGPRKESSSGSMYPANMELQLRLMREDHRAAETSLRMEGTTVRGPVYLNGTILSGRLKMNGLKTEDRLNFDGAKIRSPESIRRTFINPEATQIVQRPHYFRKIHTRFEIPLSNSDANDPDNPVSGDSDDALSAAFLDIISVIEDEKAGVLKARGGSQSDVTLDLLGAEIGGRLTFERDRRTQRVNWFGDTVDDDTLEIIRTAMVKNGVPRPGFEEAKEDSEERFDREDHPMQGAYKSIYQKEELSRRAIVSGGIRLSNATVKGDAVFRSCLFDITDCGSFGSAHNAQQTQSGTHKNKKRIKSPITIKMKRCVIEGKLDFRSTFGMHKLDARNSTIYGGFVFSDPPDYDPDSLAYKDLEERAWFAAYDNQVPSLNIKSLKVGGNATLVFNQKAGPIIKASYARIDGHLAILPTDDPLLMGEKLKKSYAHMIGEKGLWARVKAHLVRHSIPVRAIFTTRTWNILDKTAVSDDEKFLNIFTPAYERAKKTNEPRINLSGARSAAFAHHPLAWPKQDGLKISGFEYHATDNFGPLGFGFRMWDGVIKDTLTNARRTIMLSFLSALLIASLLLFSPQFSVLNVDTSSYPASLFLAFTSLAIISGAAVLLGYCFKPNIIFQRSPTAVDWLRLQRRNFPKQRAFATLRPTDAYLRAAMVMRNGGRDQEAALIELARLKERLNGWSNRRGPISKGLSWLFLLLMRCSPRLGWLKFVVTLPILAMTLHLSSALQSIPMQILVAIDTFLPFTEIVPIKYGCSDIGKAHECLPASYITPMRIHAVLGWISLPLALAVMSSRLESFVAKTRLNLFE